MSRLSAQMAALPDGIAQLSLPLKNLDAPPGLEMFEACSLPSKAEQELKEDSQSDTSTSQCSTVVSPTNSTWTYMPGEMLQRCADFSCLQLPGPPLILLEEGLPAEMTGSRECPSIGSAYHHLGLCKPCDFMHRGGCRMGYNCQFCHLCSRCETRRQKRARMKVIQADTRMASHLSSISAWPKTSASKRVALTLNDLVQ